MKWSRTIFDTDRPLLFSIAYRMLGSASDAEDGLQDACAPLPRGAGSIGGSPAEGVRYDDRHTPVSGGREVGARMTARGVHRPMVARAGAHL
jgi:hypothetical protein